MGGGWGNLAKSGRRGAAQPIPRRVFAAGEGGGYSDGTLAWEAFPRCRRWGCGTRCCAAGNVDQVLACVSGVLSVSWSRRISSR